MYNAQQDTQRMEALRSRRSRRLETEERSGETNYWDEDDPRALYYAVIDACWIYQYRNLQQNLRNLSWKQARKRTLSHGALSNEWMCHRRGDVRLRKRGLEMRFRSGNRLIGWQRLQDFVRAERL